MANPRALTQFAFAAGIDEAQQGEVLDPSGGFTRLENVRQLRRGAISKRLGYDALTAARLDATTRTAVARVASYGQSLVTIDGTILDTYSPTANAFVSKNRVPECTPTRIAMPFPGGSPQETDVLIVGSYVVVASVSLTYTLALRLTVSVVDLATGTVLRTDVVSAALTQFSVRLASVGTTAVIIFCDSANTIKAQTLDMSSAAGIDAGWSTPTSLKTDFAHAVQIRFDAVGMSDRFAIAYPNNTGGANRVTVATFTAALAVIETRTLYSLTQNVNALAVSGTTADMLWTAYSINGDVYAAGVDATSLATDIAAADLVLTSPPTEGPVTSISLVLTATQTVRLVCSSSDPASVGLYATDVIPVAGLAAATGTPFVTFRLGLISKAFLENGRVYALVAHADYDTGENLQYVSALVDVTDVTGTARAVAVPAIRQTLSPPYVGGASGTASYEGGHYAAIVTQKSGLTVSSGAALELVRFDFADTRRWQTSQFAESLMLSGGVVSAFDGSRVSELGFLVRPDTPSVALGAGVGVTGTSIRYIAIYQRSDGAGNVHWSSPSDPSDPVSPANQSVDVDLSTLCLTSHEDDSFDQNPTNIAVYRSGDNGALPYQFVYSVENDSSVSQLTFSDSVASVVANAELYRQPGLAGAELAHQCPPACSILVPYSGMLVGVADDGVTLWYSAYRIPGEGVWFSDVFQLPIIEEGPITACAPLDGTLFVFKRSAIFAVAGSSPSGNGAQGGFGDYRQLASDVGCIEPRSVVVTALGVFFQSERGIEILSRAQSAEWVGEPVQATLAAFPIIVAATLDAASALVRFECVATDGETGVQLVYDLTLKTWVSVDKIGSSTPATSACMGYLSDAWRYCRSDAAGVVYYERSASDAGAYRDGTEWVTMLAETGWLKLGGIQGRHMVSQVQWLARKETRADYSLSLAYDYAPTYKTAASWTADAVDALSTSIGRIQLAHPLHDDAEGVSVRVLLEDATPTGGTVSTGQGATWIAATFEGTPRDGATALPEGSR